MNCIYCHQECENTDNYNMQCNTCNCSYYISSRSGIILDIYFYHGDYILRFMIDYCQTILYKKRTARIIELPCLLWVFPANKQSLIKRLLDMQVFS